MKKKFLEIELEIFEVEENLLLLSTTTRGVTDGVYDTDTWNNWLG